MVLGMTDTPHAPHSKFIPMVIAVTLTTMTL